MTVSFAGMAITLHKSRIHCSGIMQWWLLMSLQFTKSATLPAEAGCETWGRIVWNVPLSRDNNMATKVHFSYGSRHFDACDCWTQTSVAGNAARQRLLIAISHGVKRNTRCEKWKDILLPTSFIRCEKKHCCQRSAFLGLLQ